MDKAQIFIIFISLTAIFIVGYNCFLILKNTHKILKRIGYIAYIFCVLKYLTLIVYGCGPSLSQVQALRPFYFITMIGLNIPWISAIWYITPFCKMKWPYKRYLLFFLPWIIFWLSIICFYPGQVQTSIYGYEIHIMQPYLLYYAISQLSFSGIILGICMVGWVRYKNERLRSQYLVFIFSQILLLVDLSMLYFREIISVFPPFTVTEILALLGIAYAFSQVPIEKKYKE